MFFCDCTFRHQRMLSNHKHSTFRFDGIWLCRHRRRHSLCRFHNNVFAVRQCSRLCRSNANGGSSLARNHNLRTNELYFVSLENFIDGLATHICLRNHFQQLYYSSTYLNISIDAISIRMNTIAVNKTFASQIRIYISGCTVTVLQYTFVKSLFYHERRDCD